MPHDYQIGLLGRPTGDDRDGLIREFALQGAELGLALDAIKFVDESDLATRDRKMPFIGVFFGYSGADDASHPLLDDLLKDSAVIVPLVGDIKKASEFVPVKLSHINCLAACPPISNFSRIVTVVLENLRLLRSERRLFISYKRTESQGVAIQLYEALDALGFDVFLDTRGVPPAADFQSVLWHRLADSDVVILLDTPNFRKSRWTVQELSRANATSIQILHLLWPGVAADRHSAFSNFRALRAVDFPRRVRIGDRAKLTSPLVRTIGRAVEGLRARALASRFRYLVDNFCDAARSLGQTAAVQATRFIELKLSNGKNIAVVPAIGVPNAARYQGIEAAILASPSSFAKIWLLYDERGILQGWLDHVDWLNKHLPISAVRVSHAPMLIAMEAAR